ncbi:multiprotein bridging factor aMBF1 [Conexivisphaera calida]|nr:multiprotein bridging factor aMBF1 [Conexivisphaera calida]
MERCEVCGRPIYGKPYLVMIEGVVMRVCDECARLGTPYNPQPQANVGSTLSQRPVPHPRERPREEDLEELVVAPDYNKLVKDARERMGLTQEELAAKVGVKTSVISKVESGRFRPDIPTARRLEGVLKIKILTRMDELET